MYSKTTDVRNAINDQKVALQADIATAKGEAIADAATARDNKLKDYLKNDNELVTTLTGKGLATDSTINSKFDKLLGDELAKEDGKFKDFNDRLSSLDDGLNGQIIIWEQDRRKFNDDLTALNDSVVLEKDLGNKFDKFLGDEIAKGDGKFTGFTRDTTLGNKFDKFLGDELLKDDGKFKDFTKDTTLGNKFDKFLGDEIAKGDGKFTGFTRDTTLGNKFDKFLGDELLKGDGKFKDFTKDTTLGNKFDKFLGDELLKDDGKFKDFTKDTTLGNKFDKFLGDELLKDDGKFTGFTKETELNEKVKTIFPGIEQFKNRLDGLDVTTGDLSGRITTLDGKTFKKGDKLALQYIDGLDVSKFRRTDEKINMDDVQGLDLTGYATKEEVQVVGDKAENAKDAADAADQLARNADTKAGNAKTVADNAKAAADEANLKADTAKETADVADAKAGNANTRYDNLVDENGKIKHGKVTLDESDVQIALGLDNDGLTTLKGIKNLNTKVLNLDDDLNNENNGLKKAVGTLNTSVSNVTTRVNTLQTGYNDVVLYLDNDTTSGTSSGTSGGTSSGTKPKVITEEPLVFDGERLLVEEP